MLDGNAFREAIERHSASLAEELGTQFNAERERLAEESRRAVAEERTKAAVAREQGVREGSRQLTESLNQTLRRMRTTQAEHETLQLLLDDTAAFAACAVVVLVDGNQASLAAWRGIADDRPADEVEATVELSGALENCAESGEPVVAILSVSEFPEALTRMIGTPGERVFLYPVRVQGATVAILLVAGDVRGAAIEVLCEAAGMRLESLAQPVKKSKPVASPLVQINGSGETDRGGAWAQLSPEDQALHLRAQRTAKVRVAQIRINEPDALRSGLRDGRVYEALRDSIDAARDEYTSTFLTASPTMVDYLHVEMLKSLAQENAALLGREYPGPLRA